MIRVGLIAHSNDSSHRRRCLHPESCTAATCSGSCPPNDASLIARLWHPNFLKVSGCHLARMQTCVFRSRQISPWLYLAHAKARNQVAAYLCQRTSPQGRQALRSCMQTAKAGHRSACANAASQGPRLSYGTLKATRICARQSRGLSLCQHRRHPSVFRYLPQRVTLQITP